jgi:DNA-directed RNA polymerase specialized sigma24 family protein
MAHRTGPAALTARNALVLQWANLPAYVYRKKLRHCPSVRALGCEDAVQEGYVALIRAAELWPHEHRHGFAGYAIRAIIRQLFKAATGLIKVPQRARAPGACAVLAAAARRAANCRSFSALSRGRPFDMATPQTPRDRSGGPLAERAEQALAQLQGQRAEVVARCVLAGESLAAVARAWGCAPHRVARCKEAALAQVRRALAGCMRVAPPAASGGRCGVWPEQHAASARG